MTKYHAPQFSKVLYLDNDLIPHCRWSWRDIISLNIVPT